MLGARLDEFSRELDNATESGQETKLSRRELDVLHLLQLGLTKRQIATELYVSHHTVHSHSKSLYRKLGASSREQALDHARAIGLLHPEWAPRSSRQARIPANLSPSGQPSADADAQ
jgi:LuxR family maltose regulon positive regulatory protein